MRASKVQAKQVERLAIDPRSPWWGLHIARYRFAARYIHGCRNLDVACGTGYGLPILRTQAKHVVGLDLDLRSAEQAHAQAEQISAVDTCVADGCSLPFADCSFDSVTSFETLEHLEQRQEFIAELRRVLTSDGLCILSTPNSKYTMPVNDIPRNPYHLHEYSPEELADELGKQFARVELLGQVLDSRFIIPPFWEDQRRLPRTLTAQSQLLVWRVLNKLPYSMGARLSYTLWGHPLHASSADFHFSCSGVESAPVLVALCRA